jgi:hexokinase
VFPHAFTSSSAIFYANNNDNNNNKIIPTHLGTGTNGTYTANTSAFNSRPGTDMSGTSGTNTYYDGDSPTSRPGTGMSGR